MPKFQVNDQKTGKKYVITAPDQASAMAAFQKFSGVAAPAAPAATGPGNGGTSDPNDPFFQGLALPGQQQPPGAPPVNVVPPNQHFGMSSGDTPNPIPAIAAMGDQMAGHVPILGPTLQSTRDKINAWANGTTPEASRADMNAKVQANPEAATLGAAAGATLPYAVAAEVPLLAGALGFEGPLLSRALMTGGSQLAINTGDNLAHGQTPDQAASNGAIEAASAIPFSIFGRGAKSADTARTDAVKTLTSEGIPLTAGQMKNSRPLMMAESQLGGASIQTMRDKQLSALTKAALRRAGVSADTASPAVMEQAFDTAGQRFNTLAAMTRIRADQPLQDGVLKAATDYADLTGKPNPLLERLVNQVGSVAAKNGGVLPGDGYKAINTEIVTALKRASEPELKAALGDFKEALDDGVARSMSGRTLEVWQKTRQQYANLMRVTEAVSGGGQYAAQGLLTPEALSQVVRAAGGKRQYVMGKGDLNELSRAAVLAMPSLQDSGTASRAWPYMVASSVPSAVATHAITGGDIGSTALAGLAPIAGAIGTSLAGKAMLSKAGRSLLSKGTAVPSAVARGIIPALAGPLQINVPY